MNISNFYTDFSYDRMDFNNINEVYKEMIAALYEYTTNMKNNIVIPKMEIFRQIPIQHINAVPGAYSISQILSDASVIKKLNIGSVSLKGRIEKWISGEISLEEKLSVLDMLGKYIFLETTRMMIGEKNKNVIDLAVLDNENRELNYFSEYILKDNRLYFLGTIPQAITPVNKLKLKDISIDFNLQEEMLGRNIGATYTSTLTKFEYSEIIKMLAYAALGGPSVKNLKEAILSIGGLETIQVYDKFSMNTQWDYRLNDFDFIIKFPINYIYSPDKVSMMNNYLLLVKPAYTHFIIISSSMDSDTSRYIKDILDMSKDLVIENRYDSVNIVPADSFHPDNIFEEKNDQFESVAEDEEHTSIITDPEYDDIPLNAEEGSFEGLGTLENEVAGNFEDGASSSVSQRVVWSDLNGETTLNESFDLMDFQPIIHYNY